MEKLSILPLRGIKADGRGVVGGGAGSGCKRAERELSDKKKAGSEVRDGGMEVEAEKGGGGGEGGVLSLVSLQGSGERSS